MHLEAYGLLPKMAVGSNNSWRQVMGSYEFGVVLKPGEYTKLEQSKIWITRPPFITFSFMSLAINGYSLIINSKYCPSLEYSKVKVRAVKIGDPASISMQWWVHRSEMLRHAMQLRTPEAIMHWIIEKASEDDNQITCRNISNRAAVLSVLPNVKAEAEKLAQKWFDEMVRIQKMEAKGETPITPVEALAVVMDSYEPHEILKAINDRRYHELTVPKDVPVSPETIEAALEEISHDNDNHSFESFEDMLRSVFGEDFEVDEELAAG